MRSCSVEVTLAILLMKMLILSPMWQRLAEAEAAEALAIDSEVEKCIYAFAASNRSCNCGHHSLRPVALRKLVAKSSSPAARRKLS